mgnify:CR=1 FL=1
MFTIKDILETNQMITQNNLDVRTITMGISLRDCGHPDIKVTAQKVYDKITRKAEKLVQVGEELEMELGVPIINKRISVTPVSMVGESCDSNDYVPLAKALDEAGKAVGVNFIGGFSALVDKGYTKGDRNLICSIPEALAVTDIVCSSVSVGSTKCGINMDAVAEMGRVIKWQQNVLQTVMLLAVQNWLFSVMQCLIILLWPALSMVLQSLKLS